MLDLGPDIIVHHLLPQLSLRDLLAVRQTCKLMQANIDSEEWDRRYFQEFCYDTVRLEGRGMSRYKKRYLARFKHMGHIDHLGQWWADEAYEKTIAYAEKFPIVDFDLFEIEVSCGDDFGIVIRTLSDTLLIHTEGGINAVLATDDLSAVHLCDEELIAWKNNVAMKCNLTEAFWFDEFDENDEPIPRPQVTDELVLQEDPDSPAYDDAFKLLGGIVQEKPALAISAPSFKYLLYRRMYHESVQIESKVLYLIRQFPHPLETLWFCFVDRPTYVVAGSCGNTACVVLGGADYQIPRSYELPNPIIKISGARYSNQDVHLCDILLLDSEGTLYCLQATGKQVSQDVWHYSFDNAEPCIAFDGVADLAERVILMKDGTIKKFHGPSKSWLSLGVHNAILLTAFGYLATD